MVSHPKYFEELASGEEKLFLNAAECAPNSVLSLSNLGTVYYFRGEYETFGSVFDPPRAERSVLI